MLFDYELMFSDAQDITGTATTTDSTNVIDTNPTAAAGVTTAGDIGSGGQVKVVIRIVDTFAGAGNVTFQLVQDTVSALSSVTVLRATVAKAYTAFTPGVLIELTVPATEVTERYLAIQAINSGTLTGNTNLFDAGIVLDNQTATSDWTAVTGF